jgi:uncharacterized protein involved in exopolysaccharide biosynthesis
MYEIRLKELATLLRRNTKRIVGCTLAGLLVAGLVTVFLVPRQWTVSSTLILQSTSSGLPLPGRQTRTADVFVAVLESWEVRAYVVEELGLQQFFAADSASRAVKRLADLTHVQAPGPGTVTFAVTLPGSPRGTLSANAGDAEIKQLAVGCVEAYTRRLQTHLEGMRSSSGKSEEPSFYILDPPLIPWKASSPRLAVKGALGAWLGLLVALLWMLTAEGTRLRREAIQIEEGQPSEGHSASAGES